MASLDKLIERMRRSPGTVRFEELVRVVRAHGYDEVSVDGSHHRFKSRTTGRPLVLVRPHGDRRHFRADVVRRVLEQLGIEE